jgi:hypothetical protein
MTNMENQEAMRCTAFEGFRRIASGALKPVALETKTILDRGAQAPVLIFDDGTGEQVELDFRGTAEDVLKRLAEQITSAPETPRGPGRPKLGVVGREVTLLPRHWDWLNSQPGGASVTLRKLVEEARRANAGKDRVRRSQEAAYRFLSALAGDLPGFEEATRALFAGNSERFAALICDWPEDLRKHVTWLAQEALHVQSPDTSSGIGVETGSGKGGQR